jgi:hypothetical protein
VLGIARVAGIMAAKRTSDLIPLCHPLALTRVAIDFTLPTEATAVSPSIECAATVETVGPTGVEMEALTAVQVALLTIYDMCKAVDRGMTITDVRVREKSLAFLFVQILAANGGVGQNGHAVGLHFQNAAGHEDELFAAIGLFRCAPNPALIAGDQRRVARVNAQFAASPGSATKRASPEKMDSSH